MIREKMICGKLCKVEVLPGEQVRLKYTGTYSVKPWVLVDEKNTQCKVLSRETNRSCDVTLLEDGSCDISAEDFVSFHINDEAAEKLLEDFLNDVEKIFPELYGTLSSSSWWLGEKVENEGDAEGIESEKSESFVSPVKSVLVDCSDLHPEWNAMFYPLDKHSRYFHQDEGAMKQYAGKPCRVLRTLTPDEADIMDVGPMYKIQFEDSKECDAFADELVLNERCPVSEMVEVSALNEVLSVLISHKVEMSSKGKHFIQVLERFGLQSGAEKNYIHFADLLSYDSEVLWTGFQDVSSNLDSGMYDNDLRYLGLLTPNEYGDELVDQEFIAEVANRVDWEDVASACIESGNRIIDAAVCETLSARNAYTKVCHIELSWFEQKTIQKYLENRIHLGEDETISLTADFGNGVEMDIKVCGTHDENESAWTEAVLFENGSEIGRTDVGDSLEKVWDIENDGITYRVVLDLDSVRGPH